MLIEPQFRSADADRIWRLDARLRRMLAFEAGLAAAQAKAGLIPEAAAARIAEACAAPCPGDDDAFRLAATAGNPAIPFVARLTAQVAAAAPEAAAHVHRGATSQDVIDTAMVLGLAEIAAALDTTLREAMRALAALASSHATTPIAARTLLQQATPITFGLKAAQWLAALDRARRGVAALRGDAFAVQLGGATGTLAGMGAAGPAIRAGLARRLGLADPGQCWHTIRDRVLAIGAAFAAVAGAAAKIAGDVELLMQSEVGELRERAEPGRGGSSAMPHKRNPVDPLVPVAILPVVGGLVAALATSQAHAHERAAGAWHAEWIVLPQLSALTLAAAERLAALVAGLEVDTARMAANLELHRGLLAAEALAAALAAKLGRADAHRLVEMLSARVRDGHGDLAALAAAEPAVVAAIDAESLRVVFAHAGPLASAAAEARRLIDRHRPE
ncbi:MAG: 3-carboxy-cis,cis-muconate cycloisomerase [Alphaproteobacteria bacterium]|nr:3-carboxy-cis,cis-muconate cycloisomerase [Alphaproteobacteria bacterium]